MAQVINTNSLSLLTQNNLNKSQSSLSSAIERLSSGLRINSAKDDAAGQAIANRFTANVKGLTQASRNANDGISIAQTTEGALSEINNNLQRVRELSVQATNGTNSQSDLDSIQNEITQRLSEIDRVSGQTQFNGVKVLASDSSMKIQVGANDGETITIDLKEITSSTLGLNGFNVNGKGELANTAATLKDMAGFTPAAVAGKPGITQYTNNNAKASSADILAAVGTAANDKVNTTVDVGLGTTAATDYVYNKDTNTYKAGTVAGIDETELASFLNPKVGDTTKATVSIGGKSQEVLIDKSGNLTAADDGAALYLDGTGNLTKTAAVGGDPQATLANLADTADNTVPASITTDKGTFTSVTGGSFTGADVVVDGNTLSNAVKNGSYTATVNGTAYTVTNGGVGANAFINDGKLSSTAPTYYAQADGSITTTEDASLGKVVYKTADGKLTTSENSESQKTKDPLAALDKALAQVDALRSDLGAVQNRFDSTITNLGNTVNNLSSARSRIEDADYATEVSNMSRAQILQQAGTSVLAQANQTTQNVLSLLR
ncbi:FliC/FljB family flagellin [Citrobacter braakii]|uniref:FliC/FljB family flagellin n=1 Tax=Citrobacter braakii TaxID=57706 RepID=UPI00080C8516|nr:FliC/FljB family flagellin [Citrobacter braakii]MEB8216950.1 FliC/FljB family flagellin [Citrobacter braakii]MEB8303798.1 FliC/FljB family flagellin [Citrobacter braakii]OCF79252.1 flagellin [Citrobacter freundii]WFX03086.1 FliC/FljB family flagellin [Citrobacter braakii]